MKRFWQFLVGKRYLIAAVLIGAVAAFLRLYRLTDIPFGLHVDEAAMAYDGFCLANFGVARDLTYMPVYLANFGGGQNALSSYCVALLIRLFGGGEVNLLLIRLPGVIFSLVTVLCGGLILKESFGKKAGLLGAALLAVMPYFVMSARFGLESYLLTGASTLMLYLFILAIKRQRLWLFMLAGAAMALSLYSYAVSYLIMPLFFCLFAAYLLYVKKLRLSQLAAAAVPAFVLALPLILFVIVNYFSLSPIRTPFFTIPLLPDFRGDEIGFGYILDNIPTVFDNIFFRDWIEYNAFDRHYTFYLISIPFIAAGLCRGFRKLVQGIRNRRYEISNVIILFWILPVFQALLLGPAGTSGPNINKINAVYFGTAYFLVTGILSAYRTFRRSRVFAAVLAGIYLVSFLSFSHYYFNRYAEEKYPQMLFYPALDSVLEHVDWYLEGDPLPVYYPELDTSVYFALAAGVSPYDIVFEDNGRAQHYRAEHFFNYPVMGMEIDKEAYYVIWKARGEWVNVMNEEGMVCLHDDGVMTIYGPQ